MYIKKIKEDIEIYQEFPSLPVTFTAGKFTIHSLRHTRATVLRNEKEIA